MYYFLLHSKRRKMAKWPNLYISAKQLVKRPNLVGLAFLKAKWQPCTGHPNPELLTCARWTTFEATTKSAATTTSATTTTFEATTTTATYSLQKQI